MASVVLDSLDSSPIPGFDHKKGIKELAESGILNSIPANYVFRREARHETPSVEDDDDNSDIPIIDFSMLLSETPEERSRAIDKLGKACSEWGFFMLINHGLPESLREKVLEACRDFFDMTPEEKVQYAAKHVLDPIRYGTSFNVAVDPVLYWKDFLKVFVHPVFHSPEKPPGFRKATAEYCRRVREIVREVLKGISMSLGLEEAYIEKALEVDKGLQLFIANFYPCCPRPDLAIGMPPHSDHGLLTILMQNNVNGLQVKHNGKWIQVNPLPNSFLVNTGDHIEIMSNGRYKSVEHRAMVNNETARISVVMTHGPSKEALVSPALQLVDESHLVAYREMKYGEYLQYQQSSYVKGKSCLDIVRL